MKPKIKWLKSLLRNLGWELVKYRPKTHALARRKLILDRAGVDLVVDVGANAGQFGRQLRDLGYLGAIESFEPMREAFESLSQTATGDPLWHVHHFGLGSASAQAVLHVAANSYRSLILDILPKHMRAAPGSRYVRD
jgi:hypothetical protein